jgi:AcrR family transcriptional regulator
MCGSTWRPSCNSFRVADAAGAGGRANQRRRTRKDLLAAAARLMKQGRKPAIEEIAEAAMVSRATAYRYFPNVDALLLEASLDVGIPEAKEIFAGGPPEDAAARLERVDTALHDAVLGNEAAFRMMLAQTLARGLDKTGSGVPVRQNRRVPLIDAALAPARDEFRPADLKLLRHALALILGTEGMIVCKDVLQLDDAEARKVKRWAIRALVKGAARSG